MNILYLGRYKKRFNAIIAQIKNLPPNAQIVELCFGDVHIASFCKKFGYRWLGLDINGHFVARAKKLGYDARFADISNVESLPPSDLCLMMGSLYHFYPAAGLVITKMLASASTIIISEPVTNLSSNRGIIGFLARRAANAGKGNEKFRYDSSSLLKELQALCSVLNCNIEVLHDRGKDLIVKLAKNEKI